MTTPNQLMYNYNRLPIGFERGAGIWLWDKEGHRYLDTVAGIAVCGLGHAHPAISKAISEQSESLLHTSNLYQIPLQQKLASKLSDLTGLDSAFFCNSGSEANEAAIKLTRLYAHKKGCQNPTIAVMQNAFHGRTMGAWSATDTHDVYFSPLLEGFIQIPFADINKLKELIQSTPNLSAVMLEPVQGEGGIHIAPDEYLCAVRELCDQHDLLMILDEVQTGVGRTGQWYCYQHSGILPDLLTSAKALGNGVPIGACLARESVSQHLKPGMHGSTYGGNPLACRAALAVIDTIERYDLCRQAAKVGDYLLTTLRAQLNPSIVKEVRGRGLMIGIELHRSHPELVNIALKNHLLINLTAGCVIRLLPPLILTQEQAEEIVVQLMKVLEEAEHHENM